MASLQVREERGISKERSSLSLSVSAALHAEQDRGTHGDPISLRTAEFCPHSAFFSQCNASLHLSAALVTPPRCVSINAS